MSADRQEFDEEMARLGIGASWDNGKVYITVFPEQKTFLLRGGNHLAHVMVERVHSETGSTANLRGKCLRCGYSFRLKKDGTVQRHRLYTGLGRVWCDEAPFLDSEHAFADFRAAESATGSVS